MSKLIMPFNVGAILCGLIISIFTPSIGMSIWVTLNIIVFASLFRRIDSEDKKKDL